MRVIQKFLQESKEPATVPFVIHKHDPRASSNHFDLRFLDPTNKKLLHSFACGDEFPDKMDKKVVLVKTRDHDPRWLDLESYRLEIFDQGDCTIYVSAPKYFDIQFNGIRLKGRYKLIKTKSKKNNYWILVRTS